MVLPVRPRLDTREQKCRLNEVHTYMRQFATQESRSLDLPSLCELPLDSGQGTGRVRLWGRLLRRHELSLPLRSRERVRYIHAFACTGYRASGSAQEIVSVKALMTFHVCSDFLVSLTSSPRLNTGAPACETNPWAWRRLPCSLPLEVIQLNTSQSKKVGRSSERKYELRQIR